MSTHRLNAFLAVALLVLPLSTGFAGAETVSDSCHASLLATVTGVAPDSHLFQGFAFKQPYVTRYADGRSQDFLVKPGDAVLGGYANEPQGLREGTVQAVLLVDSSGTNAPKAQTDRLWLDEQPTEFWSYSGTDTVLMDSAPSERGLRTPRLRVETHDGRRSERLPKRMPLWLGDYAKLQLTDGERVNGAVTALLLDPQGGNYFVIDRRAIVPEVAIDKSASRVIWPGFRHIRLGDWVSVPSRRSSEVFRGQVSSIEIGARPIKDNPDVTLQIGNAFLPYGSVNFDRARVRERPYFGQHRQGKPSEWLRQPLIERKDPED